MEEAIVRLVARRALSALDCEEERRRQQQQQQQQGREQKGQEGRGENQGTQRAGRGAEANRGGEADSVLSSEPGGKGAADEGFAVPASLRPLSWRLDFATRLAVSNANLRVVYEAQLVGLMGSIGLQEDQHLVGLSRAAGGGGCASGVGEGKRKKRLCLSSSYSTPGGGSGRKRRRTNSFSRADVVASVQSPKKKKKANEPPGKRDGHAGCHSSDPLFRPGADDPALAASCSSPLSGGARKVNRRDKRMPDMVEAAIGEAFEASLGRTFGGGGGESWSSPPPGPQRFAGAHRARLVDGLLCSALSTDLFLSGLDGSRVGADLERFGEEVEGPYAHDDDFVSSSGFVNSFGALDSSSGSSSEDEERARGMDEGRGDVGGRLGEQGSSLSEDLAAAKSSAAAAAMTAAAAAAAPIADSTVPEGTSTDERTAAGRQGVLRLYGAALIKLRVSVFLFCSTSAAAAAAGPTGAGDGDGDKGKDGNDKEGPSELTLRRQGVMSRENLDAVAKLKRPGGSGSDGHPPPRYARLLGQLPRDSRHLLARLGHHGYVKVLEHILQGFLRSSNGSASLEAPAAAAPAAAGDPASSSALETNIGTTDTAGADGCETAARPAPDNATAADESAPPDADSILTENPGSSARGDDLHESSWPPPPQLPDLVPDHGPGRSDPWRALQAGAPHPCLSGLVDPPGLATAGGTRLVLPMPNPFYRRVLHALCRVHGLRSRGGETLAAKRILPPPPPLPPPPGPKGEGGGGGASVAAGRALATTEGEAGEGVGSLGGIAVRHRTVEVTRGDGGGGGQGKKRPGGGRGLGDVLIPVEVLLGEEACA
ncbi:hypothetical protein Esi_0031_0069 [Ectocarpus siliculosus]|uniref:R3H domain-containing protein n=1 Tax=Ectocarpus siliculosus TaxID=2880 RepID=D8LKV8_ECTSI|nr:hypothetical protein Esi_0031_0069 [Ectocarpus siliculosus]|eukprot:CBN80091.1 hypothetical protein Esi_0031_0069 [Ectocarpus siliculosus]